MQYKEKILELIFDDNDEALFEWIETQPLLEQVDILKEFREISQNLLAEVNDTSRAHTLIQLEKRTEQYQEAILDEQLASLKLEMALKERDKAVDDMEKSIIGIRDYLRECIETNAPNAKEMKALAKNMIELEKQNNLYDPENWTWYQEE